LSTVSEFGIGQVLDLDPQVAAANGAVLQQLGHDIAGQVAGDGQPNPLEPAGLGLDDRADTDHLAFEVDQRAAAVARIDGRVGLQEIFVHVEVQIAALGADNAGRYRAAQAKGRPRGQHPVADLHGVAVAQLKERQIAGRLNPDNRQV
jgi:hypothetical protein